MRYERVKVKRDVNTVYNREVAEWEIPLLEFIFEDGNVERTGVYLDVPGRQDPDPRMEFDRLTRAYGADPQSGVPYIAHVYGQASAGVRALAKAMAEAKVAEDDAKPKARGRASRKAVESDSLMA